MSRSAKVWLTLIALGLLLFIILPTVVIFYTDWLWFGEVGYRSVFWKVVGTRWLMGGVFGLLTFLFVAGNGLYARHLAPVPRLAFQGDTAAQVRYLVNRYVSRYYAPFIIVVAAFIAFLVSRVMTHYWQNWLLFTHPVAFGAKDPVFGNDLSLYVFRLPMLQTMWQWLYLTFVLTFILAATMHLLGGSFRFQRGVPAFAPYVKGHLSILFALILLTKAYGYHLATYNLLYSTRAFDLVYGASYADIHALLPALRIAVWLAVAVGGLTLINIFLRGLWVPALGLAAVILYSIVGLAAVPAITHSYRMAQNRLAAQRPYIQRTIEATNRAFGMDKIEERDLAGLQPVTPADIDGNPQTIRNIRMWDYRPLSKSYKQLQGLRTYYTFPDVDIDRYQLDSQYRQIMLSARELSISLLPDQQWQNRHVLYTHGYGVVASTVNEATAEGAPAFVLENIPPRGPYASLRLERPEIYYGESDIDYSLVGTSLASAPGQPAGSEVNYATTDRTEYTKYRGTGGISMASPLVRLAMGLRYSSADMLITNIITPQTKILIRRHISQRLSALAPFLMLDADPYVVVADGRLYWIQDCYTTTDAYPYSHPAQDPDLGVRYNYMRNSVKAVTDAYNGTITLYVADDTDPLVRSYQAIFPKLFHPLAEMPGELQKHLRFPERLFWTQSVLFTRFHMRDPETYYTKEDLWAIANERGGKGGVDDGVNVASGGQAAMEPYYALMRLPGEARETFLLMIPFTPANRPNMIAWLGAKCDGDDYGKMLVYQFPRSELVYGPIQIEARIDQDPEISKNMTLWGQGGSDIIRGNLLVIPLGKSVLYVEPIFLRSQESDIPELKRIIMADGDRVVMEPSVELALAALTGTPAGQIQEATAQSAAPPGMPAPAATAAPQSAEMRALAAQARRQYDTAQQKMRQGDWSGYGQAIKELGQTIDKMMEKQ